MLKIITDSSANLSQEQVQRLGLEILPFHYSMDGREYPAWPEPQDGGHGFYQKMRQGEAVTTSMINSAAYQQVFTDYLKQGMDLLYIGMSSGISGSYTAAAAVAAQLRTRFPDRRITTVDTRAASLGEGLVVLQAAELAAQGASYEQVVDCALHWSHRVHQFFTVDDLRYLRRGGRISGAAAIAGTLLQIKPILWGNAQGKIVLREKIRGRNASLRALAERFSSLRSDPALPVGIAHGDCRLEAEVLEQQLRALGQSGEVYIHCYEPVTGAHVGPGTLALFFFGAPR